MQLNPDIARVALLQRLQLLVSDALLTGSACQQPPVFQRRVRIRKNPSEQRIVSTFRLRQAPRGGEQARLLQLLPPIRRHQRQADGGFTRRGGVGRNLFQLLQQHLRFRDIALTQRQPQASRQHLRIIGIDLLKPVERLLHQIIFVGRLAGAYL